MNTQEQEPAQPGVMQYLAGLTIEVDALVHTISELDKKAEPISYPSNEKKACASDFTSTGCLVLDEMYSQLNRINTLTAKVRDIIDRLAV